MSFLCLASVACGPGSGEESGEREEGASPREDGAAQDVELGALNQPLPSGPMPYRGLNLSSAEWGVASDGSGALPGTHGTHYVYPSPAHASGYETPRAFVAKGMTVFRLPFRWERLQPVRRQAFDPAELARLRGTVSWLLGLGASVLIDPHNYARYRGAVVGAGSVSNEDFADLWRRLAVEFSDSRVLYGLMNEPYDLPTEQWVRAANAAIAAIRETGARNLILVPGNAWSGAHSWTQDWYGTPNAVAMKAIVDPADNYAFEVHQYLDPGYGGNSSACESNGVGASRLSGFTRWLRDNGKRGFLGEFGCGVGATCLAALEGMLQHLDANADVYLGWTFWSGGPWWGSEWYSIEPTGGADRPQMDVLERHLKPGNPPPTCSGSATYEAEAMRASTGGPTPGGWNIWSNGDISQSVSVPGGAAMVTVVARGASAGGVWPRMSVSLGGSVVGQLTVAAASWTRFRVPFTGHGGTAELRVAFTNDAILGGEDRNLYVDKVTIDCP